MAKQEEDRVDPGIVREITGMYAGDVIASMIPGGQTVEQRDEAWERVAQKIQPFSEKIREFRSAMEVARGVIASRRNITLSLSLSLPNVEDENTDLLLIKVFISRLSNGSGDLNFSLMDQELKALVQELGGVEKIKKADPKDIVEAILAGRLRLVAGSSSDNTKL